MALARRDMEYLESVLAELEQAERDPFSYNPVDEFGKDGGEQK